jgi:two-component sensor histidine kinase/predicted hydrocarbon binding protein
MTRTELENRIKILEQELAEAKKDLHNNPVQRPETVIAPEGIAGLFGAIEDKVDSHFKDFHFDPKSGEITIQGQRYVLFRSDSMSYEFLDVIKERYRDKSEQEAASIGINFLYDIAKVIGKKDALAFHEELDLKEPIEKLSAGPVHFAYTGWANVEIFPESNPVADDSYILKFQHHNSFEAQSWIKAGKKSDHPVCTMNCGYSAGWCEESFGIPLTTVELTCEAQGADSCTFLMAPSNKIEELVGEMADVDNAENLEIPVFFKRIAQEEKLKESLKQKELLIQEIHHRVKNNLQVISSLLRLQMSKQSNEYNQEEFQTSINRVNTMAAVHEMMYQQKDFDRIDMETYFTDLIRSLVQFYSLDEDVEVDISIEIQERKLDLDRSIPIALIMNEITCNAFKHAFNGGGKFYLKLIEKGEELILTMGDDGPGFAIEQANDGLGLSLIDILCDQLDATKQVSNSPKGLEYEIVLPL